jgi:hypothetical protein
LKQPAASATNPSDVPTFRKTAKLSSRDIGRDYMKIDTVETSPSGYRAEEIQ